ncbi:tryptophan synthase, alpha chain [Kandleria vitulina]|uniref:Tryptophan synthase alpha chain n=1 Tax=Kandleria vitulina TaxID=1630 RepID=A0A1H2U457_9FIRM|nr:tryptophan synthase subunit alpha [Kandleria vitulina]SDW50708.1 tryptophan synthase, alpha chain [Kandleria vitulina]
MIKDAFQNKALIAFVTAGDPTLEKTKENIKEIVDAGATLVEIGIPFSDPIAEGPIIQEASLRALTHGVKVNEIFEMVKELREDVSVPLCFMTYANVLFHYGYDAFLKRCDEVGINGLIIPDMPFEEKELKEAARDYDVNIISMIAPTSRDRVKMIAKEAEGFIYLVSSLGVTGERDQFSDNLKDIIGDIRSVTDVPVAIGFGIHEPSQAKAMAAISDGIIVGSAIVKRIGKHEPLYDYVKSLKDAIKTV